MTTPLHEPDGFPDTLRTVLADADVTIVSVLEQFGLALQRNVLGRERMTREKLERLLQLPILNLEHKQRLLEAYEATEEEGMRGVVIEGIRRYTQEDLAKRAGVSVSALRYIRNGDSNRRGDAHEVQWGTWSAIASVMALSPFRTLQLWRGDTRCILESEGITSPLGQEAELLMRRRPEHSANRWKGNPPEQFAQWSVRGRTAFLKALREGNPQHWDHVAMLLDATSAETAERLGMIVGWLKAANDIDDAEEKRALGEPVARALLLPTRERYLRQAHADVLARRKSQ